MTQEKNNPSLLLHTCCAICGAYLTEILKKEFNPIIFFYNPNIHPQEEYEKRKDSAKKLAENYQIEFIEGAYDAEEWHKKIKGLEKEPEGGKRCPACFEMRLLKTASLAKERDIDNFTTTLAVSPYKNETIISQLGEETAKNFSLNFLKSSDLDMAKKDIWQKTRILAKQYGFYHQKYCGCVFSNSKQ